MRVVTVAQMKQIEKLADANGVSYYQMMENAGLAAYAELQKHQCKFPPADRAGVQNL